MANDSVKLDYELAPFFVHASPPTGPAPQITLKVVATNAGDSPIELAGIEILLPVGTGATALTADPTGITPVSPAKPPSGWLISSPYFPTGFVRYVFQPADGTAEVAADASLEFTFEHVVVNAVPGPASVTVVEGTGGCVPPGCPQRVIELHKLPPDPSDLQDVRFWPGSATVAFGGSPTLNWSGPPGPTYTIQYGFTTVPKSGDRDFGPDGSFTPEGLERDTTFTLNVAFSKNDISQTAQRQVQVTVEVPRPTVVFTANPLIEVTADGLPVELFWYLENCKGSSFITTPEGDLLIEDLTQDTAGSVPAKGIWVGSCTVPIQSDYEFTLHPVRLDGTPAPDEATTATVEIPPPTCTLRADPSRVTKDFAGTVPVTLKWSSSYAYQTVLTPAGTTPDDEHSASGQSVAQPVQTSRYTLMAWGPGRTAPVYSHATVELQPRRWSPTPEVFDGGAWADGDASHWKQAAQYETIRLAPLGAAKALIIGRTPLGLDARIWEGTKWGGVIGLLAGFKDDFGWSDKSQYETLRLEPLGDGRALLIGRGYVGDPNTTLHGAGIAAYTFDPSKNPPWNYMGHGPPWGGTAWAQPSWYDTIRLAPLGDGKQALLIGRAGNSGIWTYKWNGDGFVLGTPPSTQGGSSTGPPWNDESGWSGLPYYRTIRLVGLGDGTALLVGRGVGGIATYLWTGTEWAYKGGGGFWSDNAGWAVAQYYDTIRLVGLGGGKALLVGRGIGGIVAYLWNGMEWVAVGGTLSDFADALGWDQPQVYSTIRLVSLGQGNALLTARGAGGINTYYFYNGQWLRSSLHSPNWSYSAGWDNPCYNDTIRLVTLEPDPPLLIARGAAGVEAHLLDWSGQPPPSPLPALPAPPAPELRSWAREFPAGYKGWDGVRYRWTYVDKNAQRESAPSDWMSKGVHLVFDSDKYCTNSNRYYVGIFNPPANPPQAATHVRVQRQLKTDLAGAVVVEQEIPLPLRPAPPAPVLMTWSDSDTDNEGRYAAGVRYRWSYVNKDSVWDEPSPWMTRQQAVTREHAGQIQEPPGFDSDGYCKPYGNYVGPANLALPEDAPEPPPGSTHLRIYRQFKGDSECQAVQDVPLPVDRVTPG